MQISMWSSYFVELSPEDMVTTFVGRGWKCTELSDEHGRVLLERGDPAKTGAALRKFAADLGFSFLQGHLLIDADIIHPDHAEQERTMAALRRWCDLFAALGIPAAVLHPGGDHMAAAGRAPAEILERRIAALNELSEYTRGGPTTICLENITCFGNTVDDMLRLIHAVNGGTVRICLDTGHLNLVEGDCAAYVRAAGDYLKALHIADNAGDRDAHLLPYGGGAIRWDGFLLALQETGYDGLFNLEVPGESHCPTEIKLAKLDYAHALATRMTAPQKFA